MEQLQRVAKERDDFRQQASVRLAERDAIQAQLVQFGRDLQNLAQKIEQTAHATTNSPQAATPANTVDTGDTGPKS
jgi:hypothetical protein